MSQEPITCECPKCGKTFRVPPDLQGKKIVCKGCQTHFIVPVTKPGPAMSQAVVPVATLAPAARASARAKAAPAAAASPTVTNATVAPAPTPPPSDDFAPIPFDDAPIALSTNKSGPVDQTISTRVQKLEKIKFESKGPYFVVKLVLAGNMIHVGIENTLNEHAADGWKLDQIVRVDTDAYAILRRDQIPVKNSVAAESSSL